MFRKKMNHKAFFSLLIGLFFFTNSVYAFWYSGNSGSDIQSSTSQSTTTSNNSSPQSGPSGPSSTSSQSGPTTQSGPTSQSAPTIQTGPTIPTTPTIPTYPLINTDTNDSNQNSEPTNQTEPENQSENQNQNESQNQDSQETSAEQPAPEVAEVLPPPKSYPNPTETMSDSELKEISENGNSNQRQAACIILSQREHKRQNDNLLTSAKIVDEKVDEIITKSTVIPDRQKTNPGKEVQDNIISETKKESVKKEKVIAEKLPENKKKSEKKQQTINSKKSGDPVKISEGAYEQNEIDFSFSTLVDFSVKRKYSSSSSIISAFGYGWSTNLDERIILGTEVNPEEHRNNLIDYSGKIDAVIKSYENQLAQAYEVTDIYSAPEIFSSLIAEGEKQTADAQQLLSEYESLLLQAEGYEAAQEIEMLKEKTQSLIDDLNTRLSWLQSSLSEVENHLLTLAEYKQVYRQSLNSIEAYAPLYQLSMERKARNRTAMFSGMDLWYEETGLDTLTLIDEDSYPHIFKEKSGNAGQWENKDERKYLEILSFEDGFKLRQSDGIVKLFDARGFLHKIIDRNGNWVLLNRSSDEKLTFIETSNFEKLKIDYNGNFICKITNLRSPEQKLVYAYDGVKLIHSKDIEGDAVSFEYDENKRMCRLIKSDGSCVKMEYGEVDYAGNVITTSTQNEEGFAEYFIYDKRNKHTDYIDHDDNKYSYWYDDKNRTIKEVLPDGSLVLYEYDDRDNLIRRNENGFVIQYSYDANGNKLSEEFQDGSRETWEYDDYGLVIQHKDRDGVVEEYRRDEKGNLLEYRKGGLLVYEQTFYPNGLVKTIKEACQSPVITECEYDQYGNLVAEKRAGVKTEYAYDSQNRLKRITKAGKVLREISYEKGKTEERNFNGLVRSWLTNGRKDISQMIEKDSLTGLIHEYRIEYDKRHLPLRVFAGDGSREQLIKSYLHSAEGKLLAEIFHGDVSWVRLYDYKAGLINQLRQFKLKLPQNQGDAQLDKAYLENAAKNAGNEIFVQKYQYEINADKGKKISLTDMNGFTSIFEYDACGNLIRKKQGNGQLLQYRYSKAGRLMGEQSLYGGWYEYAYDSFGYLSAFSEAGANSIHREYYPGGRMKSQTDRKGQTLQYAYDEAGRLSSLQNESKKITYEYDAFDRVTKQSIGRSGTFENVDYFVCYEYSEDGRSFREKEGGLYETIHEFDAFGNLVKKIDGKANERSYVYNYLNQLIESYDGYGNKTSYEYNSLGQRSKIVLPDSSSINYSYNYLGLLVKVADECGTFYEASYGSTGLLEKEWKRGDVERNYEYDEIGRVREIQSGGDTLVSYSYSQYNRSFTVRDGKGKDYLYNYDSFGRLVSELNRKGKQQTFTYDEEGKLKNKIDFAGNQTSIVQSNKGLRKSICYFDGSQNDFIYDSLGKLLEMQNQNGKSTFKYDLSGRMIHQKDEKTGEEVFFSYDSAGNRSLLESSTHKTTYIYGKNNELKEIFDNKQKSGIKLFYDENGREVLRKFANGTKEETLYDKAGRVIVKHSKSERGELLWGQGYVYDEKGKLAMTVDSLCRVTIYEYNEKGQLKTIFYPYVNSLSERLKNEAALNGLPSDKEIGENRFLTSGEKASLIPLLNSMQSGLGYNLQNLQLFIRESYAYDGNGNRKTKTTGFGSIEYKYDSENCLLSSGSRSNDYVTYTYDEMGNLLSENSSAKEAKYAYTPQNRLAYAEVIDKADKTFSQTAYEYDAAGRRLAVHDMQEVVMSTVYDGLSFDVLRQCPLKENGNPLIYGASGIEWGRSGRPNGGRYRFIGDEELNDGNRYFYIGNDVYKKAPAPHYSERTIVSINHQPVIQSAAEGAEYYSTDSLGSLTCLTDQYGSHKSNCTYDAFGNILDEEVKGAYGFYYLGKELDSSTGFYNYGFRDYAPELSRFTSSDPVRDGLNWYSYCKGDPVNFIDLWGLEVSDSVQMFVYRDKKSYSISGDRENPKNMGLDIIVLYNTETKEYKVFENVQTVANYPSTDADDNKVDSCFMDTIGTCTLEIQLYTTTNVAGGEAAVITNATTIDGRIVDKNGYTENALSDGRSLVHSNEKPDKPGQEYLNLYSKQCFILKMEENNSFFETLREWNLTDNSRIKATVFDTDRRDR